MCLVFPYHTLWGPTRARSLYHGVACLIRPEIKWRTGAGAAYMVPMLTSYMSTSLSLSSSPCIRSHRYSHLYIHIAIHTAMCVAMWTKICTSIHPPTHPLSLLPAHPPQLSRKHSSMWESLKSEITLEQTLEQTFWQHSLSPPLSVLPKAF